VSQPPFYIVTTVLNAESANKVLYLSSEGAGSMKPSTRVQTRGRMLICNASMQDMDELFPKY